MRMLQLETSVSGTNTHLKKGQARNLTNCGHLIQETCDPDANAFCSNNCKVHTQGQDCYRPVPDVMAEHPGEDGYCYFNQTGFWVSPLPVPPNFETSSIQGILGLRGADYHGKDQGPLITFHFEGQVGGETMVNEFSGSPEWVGLPACRCLQLIWTCRTTAMMISMGIR